MCGRIIGSAIVVDCFHKVPKNGIYFLTEGKIKTPLPSHVDKVYTSVYNARLLHKNFKVDPNKIVKLPSNQKLLIQDEIKDLNFFVTLIDAKQQPGSVMFLFQGSDIGNILYSGKCCYSENLFCQSLENLVNEKLIDYFYIHEACGGCDSHSFSVASAIDEVVSKVKYNPNCKMLIIEPNLREDILIQLKEKLKEKVISVSENFMKHLEEVGGSSGFILDKKKSQIFVTDSVDEKCRRLSDQMVVKIILIPCPVSKRLQDIEANLQRLEKKGYHVIMYKNHCSHSELVSLVRRIDAKHSVLVFSAEIDENKDLNFWSYLGVDFINCFSKMSKHLEEEPGGEFADSIDMLSYVGVEERTVFDELVECDKSDINGSVLSVHSSERILDSNESKETTSNTIFLNS